ncbi:MAG: antitermination protein NusG [Spirochaetaceae bacterium]|jgi:transcriptional antiterminator NusG|nr:antitermination protein NusG [Spirochaetaceae bacterium]
MRYYTIQVKTRAELKFMRFYKALYPGKPLALYFPRKEIPLRKLGVMRTAVSAVLPGYIFIELDGDVSITEYYWELRRTPGFFRFLVSNRDIRPLAGTELELVLYLLKAAGPVAGISKVSFDENSRIVVREGPLKGFEGRIIKVDKRKGRARVQLDLYNESHWIDLAFQVIAGSS